MTDIQKATSDIIAYIDDILYQLKAPYISSAYKASTLFSAVKLRSFVRSFPYGHSYIRLQRPAWTAVRNIP